MLLNEFKLHTPKKITEAIQLYHNLENVKIKAGGTFLINNLKSLKKKRLKTPENIVSLSKIPELKGINKSNQEISIKSMTTMNEIIDSDLVPEDYDVIKDVAKNIGTTPIRNMATIGGNLTCRYTWTEFPAVMIALDAKLNFITDKGKIEIISAEEFFKNNAKTKNILCDITINHEKNIKISYYRTAKSSSIDIPILAVCIKTIIKDNKFSETKVCVNDAFSFAKRDLILEEFLNNKSCKNIDLAKESLNHLDNSVYESKNDEYKKHMFNVAIKNTVLTLINKQIL